MYNAGQVRLVSVGRFKEGELRVSDFGKRLRSTGESFLADVDIAVAHGGAFMAGGAPYLGKGTLPPRTPPLLAPAEFLRSSDCSFFCSSENFVRNSWRVVSAAAVSAQYCFAESGAIRVQAERLARLLLDGDYRRRDASSTHAR
jgi:hypothetical protein